MLYFVYVFFLRIFLKLFNKLEVRGLENLPKTGPLIIVANHSSYLDPLAISCSIPQKIYWMVLRPIYRVWWLNWFFRGGSTFPIDMEKWTLSSIRRALAILRKGRIVGIFPEGGRSHSGRLGEIKSGAAALSLKSGAPILPIGIQGAFESYPPKRLLPKAYPITVRIGKVCLAADKTLSVKPVRELVSKDKAFSNGVKSDRKIKHKQMLDLLNQQIKASIEELMSVG